MLCLDDVNYEFSSGEVKVEEQDKHNVKFFVHVCCF